MTEPAWFRSRLKAWRDHRNPPKVSSDRPFCEECKTDMSATPDGWVCFYCKFSESSLDLEELM